MSLIPVRSDYLDPNPFYQGLLRTLSVKKKMGNGKWEMGNGK